MLKNRHFVSYVRKMYLGCIQSIDQVLCDHPLTKTSEEDIMGVWYIRKHTCEICNKIVKVEEPYHVFGMTFSSMREFEREYHI